MVRARLRSAALLIALSFVSAQGQEPPPDPFALAGRLGDPSFAVREAAQRDLIAMGEAAGPALDVALAGGDPEVVARTRVIMETIGWVAAEHREAVGRLLTRLEASGDAQERRWIVEELLRLGPPVRGALVRRLNTPEGALQIFLEGVPASCEQGTGVVAVPVLRNPGAAGVWVDLRALDVSATRIPFCGGTAVPPGAPAGVAPGARRLLGMERGMRGLLQQFAIGARGVAGTELRMEEWLLRLDIEAMRYIPAGESVRLDPVSVPLDASGEWSFAASYQPAPLEAERLQALRTAAEYVSRIAARGAAGGAVAPPQAVREDLLARPLRTAVGAVTKVVVLPPGEVVEGNGLAVEARVADAAPGRLTLRVSARNAWAAAREFPCLSEGGAPEGGWYAIRDAAGALAASGGLPSAPRLDLDHVPVDPRGPGREEGGHPPWRELGAGASSVGEFRIRLELPPGRYRIQAGFSRADPAEGVPGATFSAGLPRAWHGESVSAPVEFEIPGR